MSKSKGQWYKGGFVYSNILDTKIDYTRTRMSEEKLIKEYNRLRITKVNSYEEFIANFKFKPDKAPEYYRQYKYRDELIARGQYDEIRAEGYRNALVTKIQQIIGDGRNLPLERIMENLNNLSPTQLVDIIQANSGEKGIFGNLPSISLFYNITGTVQEGKEEAVITENYLEDKVKKAFAQIGVKYDDDPYGEFLQELENANEYVTSKYKSRKYSDDDIWEIYRRDELKKSKDDFISTYARRLPRSKLEFGVSTDQAVNALVEHYKEHITSIKIKKDGNAYIPFVKKKVSNIIISHIYGGL